MRTEISTLGKEETLRRLFENSGFTNSPVVRLGEKETAGVATSHKILLEGVDFDLVYMPLKHLGYKALLYAIGDLYAAFRNPVAVSVNLGLSSRFCFEEVQELWQGVLAGAREHGIGQLTLDLNPSLNGLCISLSATGCQKKALLGKLPAPANMDLICLSGRVGAAYMGLHVLEREKASFNRDGKQPDLGKYRSILAAYLSPEIKPNTVSRFVDTGIFPSTGRFVTRGLGDAVLRLAAETGFGAKIYLERIPLSNGTFEMAEELDMDPVTAAMNGGDDYQFLFTVPISQAELFRRDFQDYDVIGHLARPEVGAVMVTPEGAEIDIHAQGFTGVEEGPEAE